MYAELRWPALELVDDDGRADLFVLSRFGVAVHRLGPEGLAESPSRSLALRPRAISLRLNFGAGRVLGLLPNADGDWNGRISSYGRGAGELVVLPGSAEAGGPGFGGGTFTQAASSEGLGRAADLDGDGLDDLVLVDPQDPASRAHVLRNRGRLPGTPPALRAATP